MLLNWKNVESMEQPLEIDTTLSTQGVYFRKDIEAVEIEDSVKYVYKEVFLSNDFRFDIEDPEEYKAAIQNKIDEINSQLHITKLDFFKAFCKPAGITYAALTAKIKEVDMEADWELCNHIYYGVIKPFLQVLPLGKTEEEIIQIFEALCTKE